MSDQHQQDAGSVDALPPVATDLPPPLPPPLPLPGTMLAAARQAKAWSVEHVAAHLKLAVRQIHALEADDYAALPGRTVTRGFIRIYAKMLGLDAVPLMAALPLDAAVSDAETMRGLSAPFSESIFRLRGRPDISLARWLWLGVVVIVVALLFTVGKYGVSDTFKNWSSRHSMSPVAPEVLAPLPVAPALTEAEGMASVVPEVASSDLVEADTIVSANQLVITARQDAWVELRRVDKTVVVALVLKAGSSESFDIDQPLALVIGNAAGITATMRGEPLNLVAATKNNIVRLDLK